MVTDGDFFNCFTHWTPHPLFGQNLSKINFETVFEGFLSLSTFLSNTHLWILTALGPLRHFLLLNKGRVTYLKDIKTNFAIFVVSSEKNLFEINLNSAEASSSKCCSTITAVRGNNEQLDEKEKMWSNGRKMNSDLSGVAKWVKICTSSF